jgi:hypothetical protein
LWTPLNTLPRRAPEMNFVLCPLCFAFLGIEE